MATCSPIQEKKKLTAKIITFTIFLLGYVRGTRCTQREKPFQKHFQALTNAATLKKKRYSSSSMQTARKHQPIILPDNPRLSRVLSNPTNRDSHWKSAFQAFSLSLTIISHPHFYTSHAKFRARMPKIYPKQDPQTAEKIRQKIALFAPLLVETPSLCARSPETYTVHKYMVEIVC